MFSQFWQSYAHAMSISSGLLLAGFSERSVYNRGSHIFATQSALVTPALGSAKREDRKRVSSRSTNSVTPLRCASALMRVLLMLVLVVLVLVVLVLGWLVLFQ